MEAMIGLEGSCFVWQRMKCSDARECVEYGIVSSVCCRWWFGVFKTHASNPDDGSVSLR